jgi:hypothetical protein
MLSCLLLLLLLLQGCDTVQLVLDSLSHTTVFDCLLLLLLVVVLVLRGCQAVLRVGMSHMPLSTRSSSAATVLDNTPSGPPMQGASCQLKLDSISTISTCRRAWQRGFRVCRHCRIEPKAAVFILIARCR